jgi:hypothetical protein
LAAAVIALVFAARLAQRVAERWRPHEAVWVLALLMYAVASGAMFLGVQGGWTPAAFRAYWLFGAVLNVPFLLAGEVYLLASRRFMAHGFLIVLAGLAVFASFAVVTATVNRPPLEASLPLGKDVFGDGSLPYRLAQYFSLPAYFLLLGGLVWSSLQMKGKPALKDQTAGTFAIAVGATVVAVGSGIGAAYHVVPLFSVSLAGGVAAMFWGFLRASRRSPRPAVA